jgi:hypothetical protein
LASVCRAVVATFLQISIQDQPPPRRRSRRNGNARRSSWPVSYSSAKIPQDRRSHRQFRAWLGSYTVRRSRRDARPNIGGNSQIRRCLGFLVRRSADARAGAVGSTKAIMRNVPCNKGRLTGQKRPLKPKDVWAIRVRLQLERATSLCSISPSIASSEGATSLRLQVDDVCAGDRVRDRAAVIQKKTGPVRNYRADAGLDPRLACQGRARKGRYLFPRRFRAQLHLSTRQYARIVHAWVESAGIERSAYGAHSMRRTKAAQIYKKTATCEPSNCSSGTRSSKARSAISASRSMTRFAFPRFPSRSSCDLILCVMAVCDQTSFDRCLSPGARPAGGRGR